MELAGYVNACLGHFSHYGDAGRDSENTVYNHYAKLPSLNHRHDYSPDALNYAG